MSQAVLFGFGLFVTMVVIGAIAAIWWGAVEDGRTDDRLRATPVEPEPLPERA